MSPGPIRVLHVISTTRGLADEIRTLLTQQGLEIDVKDVNLQKYGDAVNDRSRARKLTSAALEDINVEDIEYLIGQCPVIAEVLSRSNNKVKWAQCPSAGVDPLMNVKDTLKLGPDFVMSRTTGTERGQMIAEYVIGHIISRERKFSELAELQKQASYDRRSLTAYRMLSDLSLGILGLGNIGLEVARACKAMNMTVWAGVRDERLASEEEISPDVDFFRPMSRLEEMLQEVDYLVCVLPSTPQTKNLLSGNVLEPCKAKKTVLINAGRGNLIDDESFINAIRQGWLGGAILDVLNQEPLPKESPLWSLPGVTITPHISCLSQTSASMVARAYVDNLERYIKGEPLLNEVDFNKGY